LRRLTSKGRKGKVRDGKCRRSEGERRGKKGGRGGEGKGRGYPTFLSGLTLLLVVFVLYFYSVNYYRMIGGLIFIIMPLVYAHIYILYIMIYYVRPTSDLLGHC